MSDWADEKEQEIIRDYMWPMALRGKIAAALRKERAAAFQVCGRGLSATMDLKTWPEYFSAMWLGKKTFDFRRDDRGGYREGQRLLLREWWNGKYSGREIMVEVTYVLQSGQESLPIASGWSILSVRELSRVDGEHDR